MKVEFCSNIAGVFKNQFNQINSTHLDLIWFGFYFKSQLNRTKPNNIFFIM